MTVAVSDDAAHFRKVFRRRPAGVAVVTALATVLTLAAGCSEEQAATRLELTAALPDAVPDGTVLRLGDPQIQAIVGASGLDKELSTAGVEIEWANISGGPQSIQAFRADKLDCSAVADIPSLFAAWTGTSTKIVFQSVTIDPLAHPIYKLGVAPGVSVTSLADLRGKKIAYSAGQAQGALVLRVLQKAGLSQSDVQLVELTSTGDSYVTALGSKAVDVAPIGAQNIKLYEAKYPGSSSIFTGIRDDASTLYCLTSAVEDANKAAALKTYIGVRTKALLWANDHQAEYAKAYYQDTQGLSEADARTVVEISGTKGIPASWDAAITRLQETADLLATEQKHDKLDVTTLIDRRFEPVQAAAAGDKVVTGAAS